MSTPTERALGARLSQLAWLVRQTRSAQRRARVSPADRAIAEQHEHRLDAAVAVILGDDQGGDDQAETVVQLQPAEGGAS